MSNYQWRPLTTELGDPKSPLRQYLQAKFPNTLTLRKQFRARSYPLIVDGNGTRPMTLGTVFDVMMRLMIVPGHYPVDFPRTGWWQKAHDDAGAELVQIARQALDDGSTANEQFYRACWALGLLTEINRSLQAWELGPVNPIVLADDARLETSVADLLALAPDSALSQLDELRAVAETSFLPQLAKPVELDPFLVGSVIIPASADLIAGGVLVDMKVQLGPANSRTGVRADDMAARTVLQLIGYLLLDLDNDHGIKAVGIYSARYGSLITWPVREALDLLAGEQVDLGKMRKEFPALLRIGFAGR
jgi:hypothetical protein